MRLKGIARASELPDIFHMLSTSERHGILEVRRDGAERKIHFGPNGVTLAYEKGHTRTLLGQILIGGGIINEKALHTALEEQKASQRPLGEILCDAGAAKQKDVEEALVYQQREELLDVLTWEDAHFEFHEGAKLPRDFAKSYLKTPSFPANALIMEAARRADEWQRIHEVIGSPDIVLLRRSADTELADEVESNALARRMLTLADGARSMQGMFQTLRRSEYDVYESAYELLSSGATRMATATELTDMAATALEAGDNDHACQILINASALCGDDPELRYQIGSLLLWVGADEEACKQLDLVLAQLVDEGLPRKIEEMLDHLAEEFPEAPYSHERRLKLLDREWDFETALPIAEHLVRIYVKRDTPKKTERLLRYLTTFTITEAESFVKLAKFLSDCRQYEMAAQQYCRAAHKRRHKRHDAIRLYRKALRIHPGCSAAHAELRELRARPRIIRLKMLRLAAWAAVLLVAALGAGRLLARERSAERNFDELCARVNAHLLHEEYDNALALCRTFLDEHPYTVASARMAERIEEIRIERRARAAAREFTLTQMRRRAEQAEQQLDLAAAITGYARLKDLLHSAPDAEQARRSVDRLRAEQEGYRRHLDEARRSEAAGTYGKALSHTLAARRCSPRLFKRDGIRLPIFVESVPSGAQVLHEGTVLGTTPVLLRRDVDTDIQLTLRRDGYVEATLKVPADDERGTLRAELIRNQRVAWRFRGRGVADETPHVDDGICTFSTRHGRVYALAAATGTRLWERDLGTMPGAYVSAPLVLDDRVLVATMNGSLRAFSRATGDVLWHMKGDTPVVGPPVRTGAARRVLLFGADGTVSWIDAHQGRRLRRQTLPAGVSGPVLLAGNTVYYGGADRTVRAFDLRENRTLWKKGVRRSVDVAMTLVGNTLYLKSDAGRLLALSRDRGRFAWSYDASECEILPPVTDGRRIFVAADDGSLSALDAGTGRAVWQVSLGAAASAAPLVKDGCVYAGTDAGELWVLKSSDGALMRKTPLAAAAAATPVASGRLLIVTTTSGMLQAFER